MKKSIYIFVILLTFSVGVIAFYLRPIVTPVSLCEISQHAELYQFNDVRIKAYLDVSKDGKLVSIYELKKGCEDVYADLWFSENFEENLPEEKLSDDLKKLINQLKEQTSEDLRAFAEVEVVGRIEKREMNCFALPFYVKIKEIKQTSPIKFINVSEEIQRIRAEK